MTKQQQQHAIHVKPHFSSGAVSQTATVIRRCGILKPGDSAGDDLAPLEQITEAPKRLATNGTEIRTES